MKASTELMLHDAFVVRPEDITKLSGLLSESVGEVLIKCQCADGVERQFPTARKLLEFENPVSKEIRSLSIRAQDYETQKSASLTLGHGECYNLIMRIEGEEPVVERLNRRVLELLEGMRAWYSPVARIHPYVAGLGIALLPLLFLLIALALGLIKASEQSVLDSSRGEQLRFFATWFLVGVPVVFGMPIGWAWLVRRFFPKCVFVIGQGARRFDTQEKVRWGIIVAFLVSAAAGVLVWALS